MALWAGKHSASGFRCALGPRDGEQERTLFQCFNVVHHATVQDQQLSGRQTDLLIWQVDTNSPQQVMNRYPTSARCSFICVLAFIRTRTIRKSGYFASVLELRPVSAARTLRRGVAGVRLPIQIARAARPTPAACSRPYCPRRDGKCECLYSWSIPPYC
jgi:hypothetical protein